MSFEGYFQHICENGHRFDTNAQPCFGHVVDVCPHCNAPSAWSNTVDDTNGDEYGIIFEDDFKTLLREEALVVTCNLGHPHVVRHATYEVPCEGGPRQPQRYYWDDEGYVHVPLRKKAD